MATMDEKADLTEAELTARNNEIIDQDRSTFLPRPSDDPNDPLNWPLWLKIGILLQVCLLAALGTLNTAIINPAYTPLAKEFEITTVRASYQTTVVIALNGVGPFIWIPIANVYGRRPVYLFTTLLGFVSAIGSAYSKSFSQLIVARVFNGLFPAAMALGPAAVVDLFFFHQRGRAMGLFTVILTTGAHIAPIIGGLVGQYLGWRWTFKFAAILDGVMLLIIAFCLPETLYVRDVNNLTRTAEERENVKISSEVYIARLKPFTRFPELKLKLSHFVWPALRMVKYPSVLFPAIYYAAQYGFGSILPAVTVATIFSETFGWNTLEIGLAYGGALTIGGVLGELVSGVVLDAIIKRARHRLNGENPEPEVRLRAIWTGAILLPAGLLIYGFALQFRVHWMVALFGMGLAVFGLQPIGTTCYTYSIDSYKDQGGDVAALFNFIRQVFGMTFAFYVVLLCGKIGYDIAFVLFVIWGSVLAFVPIVVLMWKGKEIRERLGSPSDI
ncbi:MFS general substrate transporter [Xylariales sp. PMI_506]|nr:MFS general substrate transporter [Xylariales sp. PMI_506]